jgi:hypothetical protein
MLERQVDDLEATHARLSRPDAPHWTRSAHRRGNFHLRIEDAVAAFQGRSVAP